MSLVIAPKGIMLPDGTMWYPPAGMVGSQQPRFWTAPPRHRETQPGCRSCIAVRIDGYTCGCGDVQSQDLLEWSAGFGYDLDPWQQWWLTEACGTKPDGRWAAFECALIVSRQNGKNQDLEVRELGGLFVLGESMIIHTAHEFKAAAEHFRRVRDTVTGYDSLRRRVKSVTTSHGDEAIELRPTPTLIFGSGAKRVKKSVAARLRFLARSRGSGRSFTADCVVYDEAMILSDDQVGASMPTMSAVANPQMIYTASAGYYDSVQLAAVRRRVLKNEQTLMGAEWSIRPHLDICPRDEVLGRKTNRYIVCDEHDDRDDPRSWAKANPALGTRISLEHVAQELVAMSPATFDRERLGVGDWPSEEEAWAVVTEEAWQACAMPDPGGATRPLAFAVDVAPDMTSATIASCWERTDRSGTDPARMVIEIPRGCSREGAGWVVPRLAELKKQWKPSAICLPKNGPAASLIDDAEKAGIEVLKAGSAEESQAFALLVTGVRERGIIHLGRELAPGLWSAVASAETRDIGDGGRGWSRRTSESDITPITAATLAYWALNKKRRSYDPMRSIGLRRVTMDFLSQHAPYPYTLAGLVKRLGYKKNEGWKVWLEDMERDPASKGLTLIVQRCGPDAYDPDHLMRVNHYFPVPPATYNERSWRWWLFERIGDVELHERMENFQIDGKPAYPPAHGPGNSPYLVLEYGIDIDRRTSFTGELNPE